MKKLIFSMFAVLTILPMVARTAKAVNVKTTEATNLCYEIDNADQEDWVLVKENVRAIDFKNGVSIRVDIMRNTITGKLFATTDHFFGSEVFPSDKSGYKYCFEHSRVKYYFNL